MMVRLNQNLWWYFARAGGLVAWGLLATSVFWGLIFAGRLTRKVPPPAWNLDIHRFLGGLSVLFVIIHVSALVADQYVDFGLSQVLVPLTSRWRPGAVAWGVVALYLLVAVEGTSLAMRRLPRKLWRMIHQLVFLLFALSTLHAIQTGSDTGNPLVQVIGIGLVVTAAVTAIVRLAHGHRRRSTGDRAALRRDQSVAGAPGPPPAVAPAGFPPPPPRPVGGWGAGGQRDPQPPPAVPSSVRR